MENLKRILIGDKTYPIKLDLNVLERIQEEYSTIHEFERKILGLRVARDKDGKALYMDNGKPRMVSVEPSVKAINTVLPMMVNEGLAVEAEVTRKGFEPVSDLWVISNCHIDYTVLAKMIHSEFKRCFEVKK